eukprot:GFUD01069760.1.p1 GENE.GFUD01069760.1~~GFUD01069760.1.p1  ORF type:complete len:231 (+),score=65.68 GFUD01069760.1:83-775(+)
MKKVRSDEGCLCFSSRCLVLTTGCFSVMLSLLPVIPCLFVLVRGQAWDLARLSVREWLQENHGDKKVNDVIATCFDWLDRNYQVVLAGIIITAVVHLLFSLLLVLGTMLYKRLLFIPWMVSDMIIIIIMVVTFTCWTFMSFFVDLLVAIVFPVVAGLMLGFCIYLWRRVLSIFIQLGRREMGKIIVRQQAGYKQVPHRKISAGDDLGDQMVRRPHRQLLVVVEDEKALQI